MRARSVVVLVFLPFLLTVGCSDATSESGVAPSPDVGVEDDASGEADTGDQADSSAPDSAPDTPNPCSDEDGDGVCDGDDICAAGDDHLDTDGDSTPDACDEDDDNDGIEDGEDRAPLNPHRCGDSDQDGCDDCAVGVDGMGPEADASPTNDGPDVDADGICDVGDACPNDPDNDVDGDYVCGDVDNCPVNPNVGQTDLDSDGIGDLCDACPLDAGNDLDGDALCADIDNCPADANPSQDDLDGDGVGDPCDPCPADPLNDEDDDGSCADVDNCATESNAGQEDSDQDSLGDACDPCPYDPHNDADQDGLCGDVDNCPDIPNPAQEDADSDGRGDPCDAFPLGGVHPIPGVIVMWAGEMEEVAGTWHPVVDEEPDMTWYRCDGATVGEVTLPDLRGRFVVGAMDSADIGSTGGHSTFTVSLDALPRHQHTFQGWSSTAGGHTHKWHDHLAEVWDIFTLAGGGLWINAGEQLNYTWSSGRSGSHTHSVAPQSGLAGLASPASVDFVPRHTTVAYIMALPSTDLDQDELGRSAFLVPSGGLALWNGPLGMVGGVRHPEVAGTAVETWTFADGEGNTVDMRGRFARGVAEGSEVGARGGASQVALTAANLPSHTHGITLEENTWTHSHTVQDYAQATGGSWAIIGGTNATWGHHRGDVTTERTTASGGSHRHWVVGDTSFDGAGAAIDVLPPYTAAAFIEYDDINTALPVGSIVLWDGGIDPNGHPIVNGVPDRAWQLCDGSAGGIPDLRGRFALGASDGDELGDLAGSDSVSLTSENLPRHGHTVHANVIPAGEHQHDFDDYEVASGPAQVAGLFGVNVGLNPDSASRYNGDTDTVDDPHGHVFQTFPAGQSTPIDVRPPYIELNYIICTGTP